MIRLRAARSTDAGAVGAIFSEFAETTPWFPQLHSAAQDIAHAGALIARGWVKVAELDGTVVGFTACDGDEVDALYVAARARGQGVGLALLDDVRSRVPRISLWTFQANTRAIAFYKRHGFVETARGDGAGTDEKLPDIQLAWRKEAA